MVNDNGSGAYSTGGTSDFSTEGYLGSGNPKTANGDYAAQQAQSGRAARRASVVSDADHAVLDAEWNKSYADLRSAGLEVDSEHPIAAHYRDASDAVNHANRSRDYAIATHQSTA